MRILLFGCCGKMGRRVAALAEGYGGTVVCGIDLVPSSSFPFPVCSSPSEGRETADIAIDFSSPDGLEERLSLCIERGLPAVVAFTPFTEKEAGLLREASRSIPIFRSENFSLGIHVLRRLAAEAGKLLSDFDAEIVERHHREKRDAPSGTALLLAEAVNGSSGNELCLGRRSGKRKEKEIGIHSVRGGTEAGYHEILFLGQEETVTLSHHAQSRDVFAAGALRAARWLLGRGAGLYGMDDLLDGIL